MTDRAIKTLPIDQIDTSRGRKLNPEVVNKLADSIGLVGLLQPISVVLAGDDLYRVIAGRHRLEAMRSLGNADIEAIVYHGLTDIEIRLAEITENLHRSELSVLERSEQTTEFADLSKAQRAKGTAQVGRHLSNSKGASGRETGDSAAARDLGLSRQKIQRAARIDGIAPDAKSAIKAAGLDNNASALLKVAAASKEEQVNVVAEIATKKRADKSAKKASPSRLKSVQEVVEEILHDFSEIDVRMIVKALNEKLAGRCATWNTPSAAIVVDRIVAADFRGYEMLGADEAPQEEIEEHGDYPYYTDDAIHETCWENSKPESREVRDAV